MAEANAFDRQLWRDFDWDKYTDSQLQNYPTEKEQAEFKRVVKIAINVMRLMQKGADPTNMRELSEYKKTIPSHLFFQVIVLLAMVANVMYQAKQAEANKLTFAIGTVGNLATLCRTHKIKSAQTILRQFALEVGEDLRPPD